MLCCFFRINKQITQAHLKISDNTTFGKDTSHVAETTLNRHIKYAKIPNKSAKSLLIQSLYYHVHLFVLPAYTVYT